MNFFYDYNPSLPIILNKIHSIVNQYIVKPKNKNHNKLRYRQKKIDHNNNPIINHTRIIKNMVVVPPDHICGDWDVYIHLNDKLPTNIIYTIIELITTTFGSAYICLTDDKSVSIAKEFYIESSTSIKIGTFIHNCDHAPFVELTLCGIRNSVIHDIYRPHMHNSFIEWICIILYRKYVNNGLISNIRLLLELMLSDADLLEFKSEPINKIRMILSANPSSKVILKYLDKQLNNARIKRSMQIGRAHV